MKYKYLLECVLKSLLVIKPTSPCFTGVNLDDMLRPHSLSSRCNLNLVSNELVKSYVSNKFNCMGVNIIDIGYASRKLLLIPFNVFSEKIELNPFSYPIKVRK